MKLIYTNSMHPVMQRELEDIVSTHLYENTDLDDDEAEKMAEQIVILLVQKLVPNMVMEQIQ
jgi:hypothetical protein